MRLLTLILGIGGKRNLKINFTVEINLSKYAAWKQLNGAIKASMDTIPGVLRVPEMPDGSSLEAPIPYGDFNALTDNLQRLGLVQMKFVGATRSTLSRRQPSLPPTGCARTARPMRSIRSPHWLRS